MKLNKVPLAVAGFGVALLLLVGCGEAGDEGTGGSAGGGGAADAETIQLTASDFAFDPTEIAVEPGQEVALTLTNEDDVTHSFTAEDLDVEVVADGGGSESTTFTAPDEGAVEFHCKFHSDMTGEISVGGSGGDDQGQGEDEGGGGSY